jgi:hypothetical protein
MCEVLHILWRACKRKLFFFYTWNLCKPRYPKHSKAHEDITELEASTYTGNEVFFRQEKDKVLVEKL